MNASVVILKCLFCKNIDKDEITRPVGDSE